MILAIIIAIPLSVIIGFLLYFLIKSIILPIKVESIAKLIKQGKLQQAIKTAKAIIQREPRNAEAHYLLGNAYLADNKAELALMEFKMVNQIALFSPLVPEAEFRKQIASLFVRFNQIEEALKEYLLLIKLEPYTAEHYYWAGKLFSERNRTDMAISYLKKAVELDPRHGKAHYELGVLLYRDKRPIEAKEELETALRLQNDLNQAYYLLGKIQKESHDYVAALLSFEKAIRDPELKIKALVERGGCYMSMNAIDKAIPELERAVKSATDESSPEVLYARYFLAMCFEKNRELDRAIEQWEKIYAKKPNFRDVAEKLSQYQEFRTDDKMKDYLTSGQNEFIEICKALVTQGLSLLVKDYNEIPNGCDIIAIEGDQAKWRNVKKLPRLLRFYRMPELIDEATVRAVLEQMRKLNITRGAIFTSSGFSRSAMEFSESRPLELYNKDQLQNLLDRVDIYSNLKKS
ncbi:MAG TPA: tetratricopeptide repeat protein [Termitinemataceae bacterium]|jgi:tetratricopeptide (TPR) repeat protein|uniref:tetratricopeptide repeat protein n=1 Tax=Treponema sp. J25 TaxID=2094121 RepID=UPI00104B06C4|nr:tetratricopeptide repeat protein [Treponema sp. J25]TCW62266.1 restriction endonuclease [Treponema sp. J25]HOJ98842.1 tetratricopeptide repeat protein [Termitinemataceae bacterium]HOM22553.1 tetratricopeptide repeat protein [Termitinemataceae bacterium]HPQ00091.1 tetratricopeptide repeat protein [Termitinemataceae bacterium]